MHFSIKNVQVHFSAVCAFRLQRILSVRSLGKEELEVMDRNRSQIRNARSVRLWSRPSLPIEAGMWDYLVYDTGFPSIWNGGVSREPGFESRQPHQGIMKA